MSKTPTKSVTTPNFIPRGINSPIHDQHGISKTIFSHVSKLQDLLNDWVKMRDKGTRLCRAIAAIKLHECEDEYYPSQLAPIMDSLIDILDSLRDIVDGVGIINSQVHALSKLQCADQPVISTWSLVQISKNVTEIYEFLQKEYRLKKTVTENVAHCRDEKLIEVYLSSWEFEAYFKSELHAYLFAEVGLTGVA